MCPALRVIPAIFSCYATYDLVGFILLGNCINSINSIMSRSVFLGHVVIYFHCFQYLILLSQAFPLV